MSSRAIAVEDMPHGVTVAKAAALDTLDKHVSLLSAYGSEGGDSSR